MKNTYNFTLFFFLLMSMVCSSQTPSFVWAKHLGNGSGHSVVKLTTDKKGNILATGSYSGVSDLDPGANTYTVNSNGWTDTYIVKLDSLGNFCWGRSIGGIKNDNSTSIAVDSLGSVFVCGVFDGVADFDPGPGSYTIASNGNSDVYILKLSPNGNFLWAKSFGSIDNDVVYSIAVDDIGNVHTTGYFQQVVDFDPGPAVANSTANTNVWTIFVSKLDSSGNYVFAKTIGSSGYNYGKCIKLDSVGNIYSTGNFGGGCDFDPGPGYAPLTASCAAVAYVLKLDPLGNYVWAKQLGGYSGTDGMSLALDSQGNVYATGDYGMYPGTGDFDPGPGTFYLNSVGQTDIYIVKLNPSGGFLWAKSIGGPSYDYPNSIAIDQHNHVFTTGSFQISADFDPGVSVVSFTAPGATATHSPNNIFISELSSAGAYIWAFSIGLQGQDSGNGICVDKDNNLYIGGHYTLPGDFDPSVGTYTMSSTYFDGFILKLKETCIAPPSPTDVTPLKQKTICKGSSANLLASGNGTLQWYSSAASTQALGGGTSFLTPTLNIGQFTYYVESLTCTQSALRTAITVTVNSCLGISEDKEGQLIKSYPNPFNGSLNIDVEEQVDYTIYSLDGKYVKAGRLEKGHNEINTEALKPGLYIAQCGEGNEAVRFRVVKTD
ncbi:MAG: SBBP repeat-containing protein [Bacteroidia bacterium]|nr:SBBP repeat-containing protein [Bacteroidia bacterium]